MNARNFIPIVTLAATPIAAGQVPSVFLSVDRLLPGGNSGERVREIVSVAQTPDGGWALHITTDTPGQPPADDVIWGNHAGGSGDVIRRIGTFGGLTQFFYFDSFGIGGGSVVYSPCATGISGCDGGIWVDDTPVVFVGQPGPVPNSTWADQHYNVNATASGEPYFIGSYDSPVGYRRGLFLGNTAQPLILPGDQPALLPEPVRGVNVGMVAVSDSGSHFIAEVNRDCVSCNTYDRQALLLDGQTLVVGGAPFIGLAPVPAAIGGTGEEWRFLTHVEVNDAGDYAVSGVASLGSIWESYLLRNGEFFLREGDPFAGGTWVDVVDLHLAESGELYHISFYEDASGTLQHGIFVDDELIYRAGDPIDWTGDGLPDAGFDLIAIRWENGGVERFDVDDDGTILFIAGVQTPTGPYRESVLRLRYGHGQRYCGALANSTGAPARMQAFGSPLVSENNLRLRATSLPPGAIGYFLVGDQRANVMGPSGSMGTLCVGGAVGRYVGPGQVQSADAAGRIELRADLNAHPQPSGLISVIPGQTWNFTAWYRDSVAGAATSNFADGLAITYR